MKKILFAIALALVATACHNTDESNTVQLGKIAIETTTRGEVSENLSSTNSKVVLNESLIPTENNLRVEIVGNNETYTWATLEEYNTAASNGLLFATAPYTVTLSHGDKGVEGWSKPYFEGSTTVEVPGYKLTANAEISVALANSIVAIDTTENFNGYLSEAKFTINGIEWDSTKEEMLFVSAGEATIVCTAKRPTGKSVTLEQTVTLKPTHRHTVQFDLSTAGNATVNVRFDDKIVSTEELEFELNENA